MKEMEVVENDFNYSDEWLKYKMTERAKILMEKDLHSKAYDKNDPKKLIRNYIEDSKDETDKFEKDFIKEMKKSDIVNIMEARCGLFPCNANFFHSKPRNQLKSRCRWCEKYDHKENEEHLFNKCNKSPIFGKLGDVNFKELCFGDNIDPDKLLTNTMTIYKDILKKRGEKT